ncbi:MAG: phytanoyl-CoA dioxygenase family protein [Pseudomonadota bacterium]
MKLDDAQLEQFDRDGFLIFPDLFSAAEIAAVRSELPALFAEDTDANITEKKGGAVRTSMGLHLRNNMFGKLVRHPRLVEPARLIAGPDLYIQQVKVNVKAAFEGDQWQWHYDFATHHNEDGVPEPLALNLHIFLDDVNHYNGPLYFIPGSHKQGPVPAFHDTTSTSYPLWVVDREPVADLIAAGGITPAIGKAGTGLIFSDLLVHGSPANMSPWNRGIFSLILNPVNNAQIRFDRPEYKHHTDFTPVEPLRDDCLLTDPASR